MDTVTVYSAGGKGDKLYRPAPVVWRSVFTPVALLVAAIVAPDTTAPEESETTPWIEPLPEICDASGFGISNEAAMPAIKIEYEFFIFLESSSGWAPAGLRVTAADPSCPVA